MWLLLHPPPLPISALPPLSSISIPLHSDTWTAAVIQVQDETQSNDPWPGPWPCRWRELQMHWRQDNIAMQFTSPPLPSTSGKQGLHQLLALFATHQLPPLTKITPARANNNNHRKKVSQSLRSQTSRVSAFGFFYRLLQTMSESFRAFPCPSISNLNFRFWNELAPSKMCIG